MQTLELPDESRYSYLSDILESTAAEIDRQCHRRFFRQPHVSGTETFYVDIHRTSHSLVRASMGAGFTDGLAMDIISITSLGIRDDESDSTYTTVTAGDTGYYLQPGDGIGIAGTDWPFEDVLLSQNGTDYTHWPIGRRAVEIVGVRGFPAIPVAVTRGNTDWARETYRQGPGGGPTQVGVNQFNVPIVLAGWPMSVQQLVRKGSPYRKKSRAAD